MRIRALLTLTIVTGGCTGEWIAPPDEAPGTCFEVFGPPGISHVAPRRHDAGAIAVGATRTIGIRLFNFCGDPDARLLALEWPPEINPGGRGEFEVVAAPEVGARFGGISLEPTLVVAFGPTVPGVQHAGLRTRFNHGYYDFEFAGEGIPAGGTAVALDRTCLDPALAVDLGTVSAASGTGRIGITLPLRCDYPFGSEHFVVEAVELIRGAETFSLAVDAALPDGMYAGVVPNPRAGGWAPLELPDVVLDFVPAAAGVHIGALRLRTNDLHGTYAVEFVIRAR